MLKLVGAVLIIFASAGLGYLKSRELMLHEKNLEEFLQVILCLKGEIRCGNSSLSDAALRYGLSMSGKVRGVFRKGGCMHRS